MSLDRMTFMRLKKIAFVSVITAFALIMGACKDVAGPEETLGAARALWAQNGPVNYTMTTQVSCECTSELTGPIVTVVRNGVVQSRRYVGSGALVDPRYDTWFPSVDGLFGLVETSIRENWEPRNAQYDSQMGYPTLVEKPGIAQSEIFSVTILKN
jgi:hypothetical protein